MPGRDTFFIGGDWTAARGTATITVVNPGTGEIVGRVPEGTTAGIDAAAAAASSGWTADPERGRAIARWVRAGTIGVSRYLPDTAAPFGGSKASGNGRDLGPEALAAHLEISPSTCDPPEPPAGGGTTTPPPRRPTPRSSSTRPEPPDRPRAPSSPTSAP